MVPRFTVAKRICADERSSSQLVVNPELSELQFRQGIVSIAAKSP
jgi:hypothetical protein